MVLVDLQLNQIRKLLFANGMVTETELIKYHDSNSHISLTHVKIIGSDSKIENRLVLSFLNSIKESCESIVELCIENASDALFSAIGITPGKQTNVKYLTIIGPYTGDIKHVTNFEMAESVVLANVGYKFLEDSHSIKRLHLSAMSYEKRFINELMQQNKDLHDVRIHGQSKSNPMPISNVVSRESVKSKDTLFEYVPDSDDESVNLPEVPMAPAPMVPPTTPRRFGSAESDLPTAASNVPFILRGATTELNSESRSDRSSDAISESEGVFQMDPTSAQIPSAPSFYVNERPALDGDERAKETSYFADIGGDIAPTHVKPQDLLPRGGLGVPRNSIFGYSRDSSSSDSLERALLSPMPGQRYAHDPESSQEKVEEVESDSVVPSENEPSTADEAESIHSIVNSEDLYPNTDASDRSNSIKSDREEQSETESQHDGSSGRTNQSAEEPGSERSSSERSNSDKSIDDESDDSNTFRLPKFDVVDVTEIPENQATYSDIEIVSDDDFSVVRTIPRDNQCDAVQINDVLYGLRDFSNVYVNCDGDSFQLNAADKTLSTANLKIPFDIFVDYNLLNFGPFATEASVDRAISAANKLTEAFEIVRVFSKVDMTNLDCGMLYGTKSTHVAVDLAANGLNKYGDILFINFHTSLNINDYAIADAIPFSTQTLRIYFNVKPSEIEDTFNVMLGKKAKSEMFVPDVVDNRFKCKRLIIAPKPIPNYSLKTAVDSSIASNTTDTNRFLEQMIKLCATTDTSLIDNFPKLKYIETSIAPNNAMEWYAQALQQLQLDSIQIRFDDANKEFISQKLAYFRGLKLDNWDFKLRDDKSKYIYGLKVMFIPKKQRILGNCYFRWCWAKRGGGVVSPHLSNVFCR